MSDGGILSCSTSESHDSGVMITISDTGTGIEPEVEEHIFEPFFSTKEEGTGLGLAVCKQIIENHGGSLVAKSKVGQGTSFIISLPASLVR